MNYRHVYMLIIEHAKSEMKNGLRPKSRYSRKLFPNQYFEFHHILPRSIYPLWDKRGFNQVALTAREHFFCHQLLVKLYPGKEMIRALAEFMFRKNDNRHTHLNISSREYERFRKDFSSMQSQTHIGYFEKLTDIEKYNAISKWRESMQKRTKADLDKTRMLRAKIKQEKSDKLKKQEYQNRQNAVRAWMDTKTDEWKKQVLGSGSRGKFWWNDGKNCVRSETCPGKNWVRGRIYHRNR